MKIRIKFMKQGAMKFVGHLDIMRYFQKAMRRAEVDICYSEGFSPHQIMSFAAPLGVGLTSIGEYLDIEVKSTESSEEMVKRLNAVMADGIEILSYKKLPDTAKNAMSIVAAADYTLCFRESLEPENMDTWMDGLHTFLNNETIPFIKKTKKGEKEMDIKPLIYHYQMDKNQIFLQVSTGSANNLKPEMVLEAYCLYNHMELPPFAVQIQRDEVYADRGESPLPASGGKCKDETNCSFISLEQLGENIE